VESGGRPPHSQGATVSTSSVVTRQRISRGVFTSALRPLRIFRGTSPGFAWMRRTTVCVKQAMTRSSLAGLRFGGSGIRAAFLVLFFKAEGQFGRTKLFDEAVSYGCAFGFQV